MAKRTRVKSLKSHSQATPKKEADQKAADQKLFVVESIKSSESKLPVVTPLNQPTITGLYYEIDKIDGLKDRLERKDTLIKQQQKKIQTLKKRITRLEGEARNRNQTITGYQSELIRLSKELEDCQKKIKELRVSLETSYNQMEVMKEEKQQLDEEKLQAIAELHQIREKYVASEEEIRGLRTELKQKSQDVAANKKDLEATRRVYRELQESFDVLLDQNTILEKKVQDLQKMRDDMDNRYTKTLDNLKTEVRVRQGECSKLLRDLQELKREKDDLGRLVDGIELKMEVINSRNISLQKKLDKTLQENEVFHKQLNHWLVKAALAVTRVFRRDFEPEKQTVAMG